MSFDAVRYEKSDGIARVTLNRPEALNAINVQVRDDLFEIWRAAALDPDVGVVIIRGAGRAFSAGADVTEFGTAPSPVEARRIRRLRPIWQQLRAFPKPVIAAVHGFAIGAGLELASLCDLRVAAEETTFAVPEVSLGLIPGAGGSQTLSRLIRPGPALNLILSGRRFDATTALRLGLVSRVVPLDELDQTVDTLARTIADRPWPALAAAKRAIDGGLGRQLAAGLALEKRVVRPLFLARP